MGVSLAKRSQTGKHICDKSGAPLGALDGPAFAEPGRIVWLADVDMFGRVRLWYRCCGAVLVEFMVFPDEPERADTFTGRLRLDDLSMPPHGRSYSVPCAGSAWSLYLPCGHLKGEGCACRTVTEQASQRDREATGAEWWTLDDAEAAGIDLSWVMGSIGPRRRGTLYFGAYWGDMNQVLNVRVQVNGERRATFYQIVERTVGQQHIRRHCTSWAYDPRNRVHHGPGDLRQRTA